MKHLIYLDFNAFLIDPNSVVLGDKELHRIEQADISLATGTIITFYDEDIDESGELIFLCHDGELEQNSGNLQWLAKFKSGSEYYLKPNLNIQTFK